jgi:hypothetical protein
MAPREWARSAGRAGAGVAGGRAGAEAAGTGHLLKSRCPVQAGRYMVLDAVWETLDALGARIAAASGD